MNTTEKWLLLEFSPDGKQFSIVGESDNLKEAKDVVSAFKMKKIPSGYLGPVPIDFQLTQHGMPI